MNANEDHRPRSITVWACPQCGYWRKEESTGIHVAWDNDNTGPGERHELEPTYYKLPESERFDRSHQQQHSPWSRGE